MGRNDSAAPPPTPPHCCWGLIQPPFGPLGYDGGTADGWIDVLLTKLLERGLESQAPNPLLL